MEKMGGLSMLFVFRLFYVDDRIFGAEREKECRADFGPDNLVSRNVIRKKDTPFYTYGAG